MRRYIAYVLFGLIWVGLASAQPRIQLSEETSTVEEIYKNPNRDFVILTASFWNNNPRYDAETRRHLDQAREELVRRGFSKTTEELPYWDEFFNGMRKHQYVKDRRPKLCRIIFEHWPGPQLAMSRETYATVDCLSARSEGKYPRSKATLEYVRQVFLEFDNLFKQANEFQSRVNAELR